MTPDWRVPPPDPELGTDEVHIWFCDLTSAHFKASSACLSQDEQDRAVRYKTENARFTFVASRVFLRNVLSRYLKLDPSSIRLEFEKNRKPVVANLPPHSNLQFNLSHSALSALCAVSSGPRVGVDLEQVDLARCDADMAAQIFSPSELQLLSAMDPGSRADAFFRGWTRKEAYAKCLGLGLSLDLKSLHLGFDEAMAGAGGFSLLSFQCPNGTPGAVAVESARVVPIFWNLSLATH